MLEGHKLPVDDDFVKYCRIESLSSSNYTTYDKAFKNIEYFPTLDPVDQGCAGYIDKEIAINEELLNNKLKSLRITKACFFQACFGITLSCFLNSQQIQFCITDSGRDNINVNNAVGMFVKNIPVALNCSNQPINDYLQKCQKLLLEIRANSSFTISALKNRYNINNSIIFQYFGDFIKLGDFLDKQFEELTKSDTDSDTISDLDCYLYKIEDKYILRASFSDKLSDNFAKSFAQTFNTVINQVFEKEKIADIDYCTDEEITLYNTTNKTETQLQHKNILEAFQASLNATPDNIALRFKDKSYSYKQLDSTSNAVANQLVKQGINKGDFVAIHVPISDLMLVCALAVFKCGAAYIPINASYSQG